MTNYIFKTISFNPLSGQKPKQAIILCHGYGGDGKDISVLASSWRRFLPEAIFLCPDAPEICKINPQGYQWFDLDSENEEQIFEGALLAEQKFNTFLKQVTDNHSLDYKNIALVGFSQGCMIIIQSALKNDKEINCLVGYSGKIINFNNLSNKIISRPKVFLMHGDKDSIVPLNHLLEAKEFLKNHNIKIKTKIFKNCEHKIPTEGSSLGLEFLIKNLL